MKHGRHFSVSLMILLSALGTTAQDHEDSNQLTHEIPMDAVRIGPKSARDPNIEIFTYYPRGVPHQRSNIVAIESYFGKLRTKLELFKDGTKHGVQREWYQNGKPKMEVPYKNGMIHGICRHFDERDNLVGQYRLSNGAGTMRTYHPNGRLEKECEIRNNWKNGPFVELYDNGQIAVIAWCRDEHSEGLSVSFESDGSLYLISWSDGPIVYFTKDGKVVRKSWRIKRHDLSEAEYMKASLEDPSLPPYLKDASQYKTFVGEPVKVIVEKYRQLPRVKIPLEFDANGNPIPDLKAVK